MKQWEEGLYSNVDIRISEVKENITKVHLKQTGIPHDDQYGNHDQHLAVARGWEDYFWNRIAKVLGYNRETSFDE